MTGELEWKTRKERVDKKLKSLKPSWSIINFIRAYIFLPFNATLSRNTQRQMVLPITPFLLKENF